MSYKNVYKMSIDRPDFFHLHHGANVIVGDDREFRLHHHTFPEIYIYLSGKAEFLIEGTSFRLNPYDIILVPPHTLHQPLPHVGEFFERYVINPKPNFFTHMNCPEYTDVFTKLSDFKYKIPGYAVKRSGVPDFVNFFSNRYKENSSYIDPLVNSKIVELLYWLNTMDKFEGFDSINTVTQDLINYIDENFRA